MSALAEVIRETPSITRINDERLEAYGNVYRYSARGEKVLMQDFEKITFEKFIRRIEYFRLHRVSVNASR